ncbi:hypothetical protein OS189_01865 [Sulfitobacter sp. F26169L]|uniref:hypothetical protein n=1 Tax=Sulfitobacter sp. F26169L TaxID=2996015 RepID=UPI002260DD66|nr:hypothetical protein [Sulfitobacter sp. F26169L]MCX7565088.1 hypothetical protein [Sulfitobacter sp. F26169L]
MSNELHSEKSTDCGRKTGPWKVLSAVIEAPRYLDPPDELIFNSAQGKLAPEGDRREEKAAGFRMNHKPCKGKPGARLSTTLVHQGQKKQHDNLRILLSLVNSASINDLARLLSDRDLGKKCGVSPTYSRIIRLEKTMHAFEQAKLRD